ncbi:hypothetical protein BJV82DRAFT_708760 [Fennellomyces sp. T-0311]|nr:hypothetical protein BJV82DRAFT_708760 [Fennellomyces sp. T-0311]
MTQDSDLTANSSFITRFPYDVLSLIFSQLSFKQCIRATCVCRAWRLSLLQWPRLWHELSDQDYDIPRHMMPYAEFIAGQEVRTLRLTARGRSPRSDAVEFIIDRGCTNIEAHLSSSFLKKETLSQFFELCGSNLTVLTLNNFLHLAPTVVFPYVLKYCPNLQHLTYFKGYPRIPTRKRLNWEFPDDFNLHQLISLNIDFHGDVPIDLLLPHFPKLRWISLNAPNFLSCFSVLQTLHGFRQCQIIRFWNSPAMTYDRLQPLVVTPGIRPSATYSPDITSGLQELSLRHNSHINDYGFIPIVQDNHSTLSHLDICGCTGLTDETVASLASLEWPNLQTFSLGCVDIIFQQQQLISFFCLARRLSTIELDQTNAITDEVMSFLGDLDHLHTIHLHSLNSVSRTGMEQFFASDTKRSKLREAYLEHMDSIDDGVIKMISQNCIRLEVLDISDCHKVNDVGFMEFVDVFANRKSLRYLGYSSSSSVIHGIIKGGNYATEKIGDRVQLTNTPMMVYNHRIMTVNN